MTAATRLAPLVAALLAVGTGVAWAAECSEIGALYRARPTVAAHTDPHAPPTAYRYQLRIGLLPPDADDSAIAELYRFQTVSSRTGKVVSELRMLRICGMGRAPCLVLPPSRPKPEDGYSSDTVPLNRDLSIDARDAAPYVLALPGFPEIDWSPDFVRDWLRADLRFFTPERVVPDLSLQELWIRVHCGPPGSVANRRMAAVGSGWRRAD